MTLYRRGSVWWYDFQFDGRRYTRSTRLTVRAQAEILEAQLKRDVRRRAAGIVDVGPEATPSFQDWAEAYIEYKARHVQRPGRLKDLLRVVLRFWGARPRAQPPASVSGHVSASVRLATYHDLRLGDVVAEPYWIERFEQWMRELAVSHQTRNHYRTQLSQLYVVAMLPIFRGRTNVEVNPFAGIPRDAVQERTVVLTVAELRALLEHASYHVRLALAIAALAPKLRLANILALEWNVHVNGALTRLEVAQHKTARKTRRPLVVLIDPQLRTILEDARRRSRRFVVEYHGRPLQQISDGVRNAAQRAGLAYGRDSGGLTFHTVRHTMATLLAQLGEPERRRMEVMGHTQLATTQKYTHLNPVHELPTLERLSAATPIADLVMAG